MKQLWLVTAVLAMAVMGGCASKQQAADASQGIISEAGQVRHVNLDTGFYGIIGEDGRKFEPINLPANFQVNRQNVTFRVKPRPDILNSHMWGMPVEVLDIKAAK
jgi:hypothetical protein